MHFLAFSLCSAPFGGCASYSASNEKGDFGLYAPSPYYGAAKHLEPSSNFFRGSISIAPTGGTEDFNMKGLVKNHDFYGSEESDISFHLNNYLITGSVELIRAMSNEFFLGWRLGMDPYPNAIMSFGWNPQYFELGMYGRFGYTRNNATYSGKCRQGNGYFSHAIRYSESRKKASSEASLGAFFNYFILDELTSVFAISTYIPWLNNSSVTINYNDEDTKFSIDSQRPIFLVPYVGLSALFWNHFQVAAGISFYYSPYSSELRWLAENSISFVF